METRIQTARYLLQGALFSVFILMGIDKYFNYLEKDWTHYIAPVFMQFIDGYATLFMKVMGAFEIIAAFGVIVKPKIFSFILSAWLLLIVINIGLSGDNYDDAIRDGGLCLAALALGILSLNLKRT
jgi:uncharacterized membrane protein